MECLSLQHKGVIQLIDTQLKNKVVLITGANHGIGAATAKAFAEQQAKVFITFYRESCRFSEKELEESRLGGIGGETFFRAMQQTTPEPLVQEIQVEGGICTAHEVDLSDPAVIPQLFDRCEGALGPVDILINNHTYCVLETFDPGVVTDEGFGIHLPTPAVIDAHFAVNARAYALMMTEYVQRYLKRKAGSGRIINVSTDAAHAHAANISYAASKHAIESYSRSAALELGKYGITVNIVAPGPIQTGYLTPQQADSIAANTPLGRIGHPKDVADVIVFLASEQAHWLTGQLLYVGGGWRMHQ